MGTLYLVTLETGDGMSDATLTQSIGVFTSLENAINAVTTKHADMVPVHDLWWEFNVYEVLQLDQTDSLKLTITYFYDDEYLTITEGDKS